MIVHKIRGNFARGFLGALAAVCAALILLQPQNVAQGVQEGLLLCYNSLIPSLFPFLILTRILLDTGACRILGLPLLPYCRLLGIRNTRAASTVAIGLLGGFAAAGCGIDALFRNGVLTAHQSSLLLCVCAVEGPAFFLFAVGAAMLGSVRVGLLLWISVLLASLLCGLVFARFLPRDNMANEPETSTAPPFSYASVLVGSVSSAVDAMLRICGFVLLFSLLRGILLSFSLPAGISALLFSLFEVSTGCRTACVLGGSRALVLCLLSMSCLGACGLAQLRALLSPQIRLTPFLFSRLLHFPLAVFFFCLLRRLFLSGEMDVFSPLGEDALVLPFQMPREAAFFLFLLLAVFCSELAGKRSLRRQAKKL